jgi:predicted dithiol-disulfide oxidoreductase (DUF899 family)
LRWRRQRQGPRRAPAEGREGLTLPVHDHAGPPEGPAQAHPRLQFSKEHPMNTATDNNDVLDHAIVSPEQWLAQRRELLAREKQLTRLHDQVAAERRALPWVRIRKDYAFNTSDGLRTLGQLFEGRSQLVVQHFMFGPGWEQGCPSCSYMADHVDGMNIHLAHRDITFVAVSRAPLAEIEAFRKRMGWKFRWVSSFGTDFNRDFAVSFTQEERTQGQVFYNYGMTDFPAEEAPGISVFHIDAGGHVVHTYSTYGRGVDVMMGAYQLMDLTPKGRDERDVFYKMEWVRHHDRYAPGSAFEHAPEVSPVAEAGSCCHAKS